MRSKTLGVITLAVLGIAFGAYGFSRYAKNDHRIVGKTGNTAFDPWNTSYFIEGRLVMLAHGESEEEAAPGRAAKIKTMIFGSPVYGDLNRDGKEDAALILAQEPGGSGTFYYVAVAVSTDEGAKGTNGIFLGDRIAPQNLEILDGVLIANYAERKPGEAMIVPPSVGISKYLTLTGNTLVEIKK